MHARDASSRTCVSIASAIRSSCARLPSSESPAPPPKNTERSGISRPPAPVPLTLDTILNITLSSREFCERFRLITSTRGNDFRLYRASSHVEARLLILSVFSPIPSPPPPSPRLSLSTLSLSLYTRDLRGKNTRGSKRNFPSRTDVVSFIAFTNVRKARGSLPSTSIIRVISFSIFSRRREVLPNRKN